MLIMKDEKIPLKVYDGKCFSCWVHQQPLKPVLNTNDELVYVEHSWDINTQACLQKTYTSAKVIEIDHKTPSIIQRDVKDLNKTILDTPDGQVDCANLIQIRRDIFLVVAPIL